MSAPKDNPKESNAAYRTSPGRGPVLIFSIDSEFKQRFHSRLELYKYVDSVIGRLTRRVVVVTV